MSFGAVTLACDFVGPPTVPVSSLLCSRWLICCLGGLVLQVDSESEKICKEDSMWRVCVQSPVRVQHRLKINE